MKEITSKRHGISLVLTAIAVAVVAAPAHAAKGGKGGGGSNDACSATASFFPAVVHAVTSNGGKNRTRTLVLASADGSCERALYSFAVQFGLSWSRMQLHVEFDALDGSASSGFVVWVDSASAVGIHFLETRVLDFTSRSSVAQEPGTRVAIRTNCAPVVGVARVEQHARVARHHARIEVDQLVPFPQEGATATTAAEGDADRLAAFVDRGGGRGRVVAEGRQFRFKCFRIRPMTSALSISAMVRIVAPQLGHSSGSTS